MAKVTAADFIKPKPGSWADQVRREYQESINSRKDERANRAARLEGILEALRAEGASDAVLEEVARQYMATGEFDVPEEPAAEPEATPVLPVEEAPAPQEQAESGGLAYRVATAIPRTLADAVMGEGFFDAMVDTAQGGLQRSARAALGRMSESDNPLFRQLAELPGAARDVASGDFMSALERASVGGVRRDMADLAEAAQANFDAASGARERLGSRNWLIRNLGEGALDAAASPSGAASLLGGPLGAVAVLDAYDQAYQQAVDAGIDSDEDRELWALSQAAPELVSFIPASRVVQRLPVIGQAVERLVKKPLNNLAATFIEREGSPALKAAMRTVNAALGEGIEEGFTGGMQDIAAGSIARLASGDLSEFARANTSSTLGGPEENGTFADTLWQSARAGFVMGGGLSAVPNVASSYADRARFIDERSAQTEQDILEGAARVQDRASEPVLPTSEPVREPEQGDLFGVPEDAPSFEEQDAARQRQLEEDVAWAQRNREREAEQQAARREELRNSYVARVDNARQEVERLQDEIEAGATDSATLNAAARAQSELAEAENNLRSLDEAFAPREEVTPTRTQQAPVQEAEPVQRDFVAEQEEQERVRRLNVIAQRRKAVQKKQQQKAKAEEAKLKTLRTRAIDSLLEENPNLSDAEIDALVDQRIAELQQPKRKAKVETPKVEAPAPRPATQPARAAAPVAEPVAAPEVDIERLKQSDDPYDRIQAEVLERLGMAAPAQQDTTAQLDTPDYLEQVSKIARNLAKSASGRAAAVENLIQQGKMVILPNATALGRENVARAGEYDPSTGTIYLYTDYLNDGSLADILEAASHESAHLAQFGGRDARSEKLRALLGDKGIQEGARKLRAAAAKGNKLAQEALEAAQADTAARGGDNRYEDLELVAYAVGAENRARTGTLGSAAGAIRDLVSGAKDQLRSKLGINLDISVNDLRSAMAKVLDEAVETEPVLRATPEVLGMIYNVNKDNPTPGQVKAIEEGNVYDSVDGTQKFVLSDSDSFVDRAKLAELANAPNGTAMRLGDLLEHDVLYRERPGAADIEIRVSDDLGPNVGGRYFPLSKRIEVSRDILKQEDPYQPTAREIILHEVQHYVQDVDGRSSQYYDSPYAAHKIRKAAEAMNRAKHAFELASTSVVQNAVRYTSGPGKGLVRRIVEREGIDDTDKARLIRDLFSNQQYMPAQLRPLIEDLNSTRDKYNATIREYNATVRQAHADYLANIAEREAYFTQYNADARQSELDAQGNPEDIMRTQEQDPDDGTDITGGRIDVPQNDGTVAAMAQEAPDTLGMAARAPTKAAIRNRNKATTFLVAAIRNDKGLGAHIRNEVELAKAAPVEFESKANRAAGQYDAAIKKLAEQRGVTPEDLNAEIRDKLEEIADMPGSASEYRAAFNKIADQYGDAGKALKRLRGLVDELSADLIRTYLDSGAKLTNKEKEDIKKVAANLGRYVHRFYASRLGGRVRGMYSKAVQDAVDKARKKGVDSLTPKQKELYDRYVRAANAILDGVKIPDAESIGDLLDSQVDYLYDTWFGTDQTGMTREEKESALLQRREEIGPEDLDNKVEAAAQALLWGVENNAATRYYDRGEKLDTTIMQKRSRIPKEIRELMGEVTDPAGALLTTVSKQAEYVARTKMLFAIRDLAAPEDLQPPGSAGNRAVRENNMTELTGEAYGPLRGYYASPALRAMIQDTSESLMNFTEAAITNSRNGEAAIENLARGAARAWMKGAAGAKAYNILGNVFRYPLNFAGSVIMLGLNGNLNVKSWGRGISDAIDIIRYAHNPAAGLGGAVLPSKYRVVDSATVGDLKLLDLGKLEQIVREMSGKSPGEFMRRARQLGMAGRELYAMMDVWSKIANFYAEADFLRALYKAEGLTKTDDEIYREASDIVNNTNMSYSRTMPFIKMMERGGITQYAPYLYEAHRVIFSNLLQSAKEARDAARMSNPKAAAMLAARSLARFAGTTGTLAAIGYASHALAGMWGDDEEDKRALLPEYARVMDFINIGKDEEGRPVLYAISNLDPLGPATDLYRAARTSDRPMEALWDQFKENYIAPSLFGATWDAVARTTGLMEPLTTRPRKPLLQQWSPDGWSAVVGVTGREDALAAIVNAVETRYLPGTARAWSDSNPKAVGTDIDSVAWNIARAVGARGVRYDPEVGAKDAFFKYDDTMKEARRALASYVENTTNPSAEEITKRLLDLRKDERRAWDQVARTYRGMIAIGMDEAEAYAKLKEAGVPKEVLRQIENEEFRSRVVSKQSLKNAAKLQIGKAKTQADRDKLEEKWNTAMEILSELEIE